MGVPLAVAWLLCAAIVVAILLHKRLARHRLSMPLVVIAWTLLLLAAMHRIPFPRTWLYLLPLLLILAGAGIAWPLGFVRDRQRWRRQSSPLGPPPRRRARNRGGTDEGAGPHLLRRDRSPTPSASRRYGGNAGGDGLTSMWRAQGTIEYYLGREGAAAPFLHSARGRGASRDRRRQARRDGRRESVRNQHIDVAVYTPPKLVAQTPAHTSS